MQLEMIPGVADLAAAFESAGAGATQRRHFLHRPAHHVDDVDVLLDDHLARERAVPEPVAQVRLGRAWSRFLRRPIHMVGGLAEAHFTQRAVMHAPDRLNEQIVGAGLKIDEKHEPFLARQFAGRLDRLATGHIDRYRFGEINVQPGFDRRPRLWRMKIGRADDRDSVESAGGDHLLGALQAGESPPGRQLEFLRCDLDLVFKIIRQRDDLVAAVLLELRADDHLAAVAAADQSEANATVRCRTLRAGAADGRDGRKSKTRLGDESTSGDVRTDGRIHGNFLRVCLGRMD